MVGLDIDVIGMEYSDIIVKYNSLISSQSMNGEMKNNNASCIEKMDEAFFLCRNFFPNFTSIGTS